MQITIKIMITGLVKNHLKRSLSLLSQLSFFSLNISFDFSLRASAKMPKVRQISRKIRYIIFCAACEISLGIKSNITETRLFVPCTAHAMRIESVLTVISPKTRPTKKAKGICSKFPCISPKSIDDTSTAKPSPYFLSEPKTIPLNANSSINAGVITVESRQSKKPKKALRGFAEINIVFYTEEAEKSACRRGRHICKGAKSNAYEIH